MLNLLRALTDPLNPKRVQNHYEKLGDEFLFSMRCNLGLEAGFWHLHFDGGKRFLDIGIGPGRHLFHYLTGNSYHALDISYDSLWQSECLLDSIKDKPSVAFERADAQEWHPGNNYDGAMFAYSLSCMKHPEKAVANVAEGIEKGGTVVIMDYINSPIKRSTPLIFQAFDPRRSIDELIGDAPLKPLTWFDIRRKQWQKKSITPRTYIFERT